MIGVRLFVHAVRMVLGNPAVTLRIGGVLLVVQLLLSLTAGRSSFQPMVGAGSFSATGFVLGVLQIVFSLWVAVAWHRYILLEEMPGDYAPRWNASANWDYLKAGIILFLIILAAIVPMVILGSFVLFPLFAVNPENPSMLAIGLAMMVFYLPAAYIGYRLSPVLPSAAVGRQMTIRDAWQATAPGGAGFVVLAVVSLMAGWVLHMPGPFLAGGVLFLGLIWSAFAQWLTLIVGASVLTTIHGHFVEGRDLNA